MLLINKNVNGLTLAEIASENERIRRIERLIAGYDLKDTRMESPEVIVKPRIIVGEFEPDTKERVMKKLKEALDKKAKEIVQNGMKK